MIAAIKVPNKVASGIFLFGLSIYLEVTVADSTPRNDHNVNVSAFDKSEKFDCCEKLKLFVKY